MRHSSNRTILGILCLIFAIAAWMVAPRHIAGAAQAQSLRAKPAIAAQPAQLQPASVTTTPSSPDLHPVAPAGTEIYTAKRGEAIPTIARHYLGRTSYLTSSDLAAAIRSANHKSDTSNFLKANETIIIPGILPAPITEKTIPVPKDFEVRAVYLTGMMAASDHGLNIIRHWREVGGNAVVFDIKDSDGSVAIPFEHPLLGEHKVYIHDLPKLVRFLHQQNMHAIARIAIFRDERLVTEHPELAVQSRKNHTAWRENGKLVWTDPSNPKVQDYNITLAKYVAQRGVDEVQFDYVRFPAEGDQKDASFIFQNGQLAPSPTESTPTVSPDSTCLVAAPRHHRKNRDATPAPQMVKGPCPLVAQSAPRGPQRSDVIAAFLKKAYAELHPTGVLLSLDVFGVMAWQRPIDLSHTGQDIVQMAHYCDVLSPMIYPSHFFGMDNIARPGDEPAHFIGESMDRFELITKGSGAVIRPWLQAFHWRTKTYSPEYIKVQVETARSKGGIGFLFWNAANDYSKPFIAMPEMKVTNYKEGSKENPKYFRGDEMPTPTMQATLVH